MYIISLIDFIIVVNNFIRYRKYDISRRKTFENYIKTRCLNKI